MKKPLRILVPIDFSRYSLETLNFAIELSDYFDPSYYLLYVHLDGEFEYFTQMAGSLREEQQKKLDQARGQLEREAERLRTDHPDLHVEVDAVAGVPFKEICRYADQKNIELIVIGTHGRTGLSHLLIGSTAERVVQQASCPVLSVKPSVL